MNFDYDALDRLRRSHPAWRLLRSDHAALAASFLNRVFIAPNERVLVQSDLAEALEDELFALRERSGFDAFPRDALDYLNDWASPEKGWLRKFYRQGSDEPQFDLTPATEKAIGWIASLTERSFVGTESRLLTLFELLRQMSEGTETNPRARIEVLRKRRDALDAEIERAQAGDLALLDDTALKDRFQQFMQLARELLTDFREVEQNFRTLDRRVREHIALWEGSKGELLDEIMSERDLIADSDQGAELSCLLGIPAVERPPGGADPAAGTGAGLAHHRRAEPGRAYPPGPLRLAGSQRAHATHGGPALAAIAALSGRSGVDREPPHHGTPARYRIEGHRVAGLVAGGRRHAHR